MADSGLSQLKVVLAHDWLTGMRGGEKVLESFTRIFPQAPVYTLLHCPGSLSRQLESRTIFSSWIGKLPKAASHYRYYLPLFPLAMESFALPACDLVLSSSHCVAKGIRLPLGARQVSYVHSPMRYVWDLYHEYFGPGRGGVARYIMPVLRPMLQAWDIKSNQQVQDFVANSRHVAQRIARHYGRQAAVIYPPVDCSRFRPALKPDDYYLVVSALVPYKRVDLAIKACNQAGLRLKIVGSGPEYERLKALAGPTVELLGWRPDHELPELYAKAKALIFPGEEDFGITPLESMASGRPVLAYALGGALETVIEPKDVLGRPATGRFFKEQSVPSLLAGLLQMESELDQYKPEALAAHASNFDIPVFEQNIKRHLENFCRAQRLLP